MFGLLERDRLDESSTDAGLETAEKVDETAREAERAKVTATARVRVKVKLEVVRASKKEEEEKKKKSRRFFYSQSGKKRKKGVVRACLVSS